MGLIKLFFLLVFFSGLSSAARNGDAGGGLVILILGAALWNWRAIMEWVQDRRWRRNWRTW